MGRIEGVSAGFEVDDMDPSGGSNLKVLFVHISPGEVPSFVQRDIVIVRSAFQVTIFFYGGWRDIPRLLNQVLRSDVIVSWFAWDQAFWGNLFAYIFRRGAITIVGGFDVASVPEISYGNLLNQRSRTRTLWALRFADLILAVSESTAQEALKFCGRSDTRVVYHGFDASHYTMGREKRQLAVTVGDVTVSNLYRKGILSFVRTASHLPDIPFFVVGRVEVDAMKVLGATPENVKYVGRLSEADYLALLRDSKVYVQVSAHEGFGCSLAEAMLSGCVPVVSDRGAIPEVVGELGFHVQRDNPAEIARAVRQALATPATAGEQVRSRIVRLFPLGRRAAALQQAVFLSVRRDGATKRDVLLGRDSSR